MTAKRSCKRLHPTAGRSQARETRLSARNGLTTSPCAGSNAKTSKTSRAGGEHPAAGIKRACAVIPVVKAKLLEGKKGLIDGCVVLDVHPHGTSGGAADAQRRHALHNDLLWQPDGGEELQHHGRRQSRARERGPLFGGRARPEGHPCACHLSGTAGDARGLRDS